MSGSQLFTLLAWAIASLGALLLLAELLLRLFSEWRPRSIDPGAYRVTEAPGLLFEFVPDNEFFYHYHAAPLGGRAWSSRCRINARGFRDRDYPDQPANDAVRLVCVGDSYTFGEGVEQEESYPKRLEELLSGPADQNSLPPMEVLNTGVAAHDISQILANLKHNGLKLNPDVVLVGFTLNKSQLWSDPYIAEDGLIRCKGLGRWKHLRESVKTRTALGNWGAHRWSKLCAAPRLLPSYHPSSWDWIQARNILREFKTLSLEHDFQLLLLIFPALFRLGRSHPFKPIYNVLEEFLEGEAIQHLNLYPALEGWSDRDAAVQSCDFHPSPRAHQAIAGHLNKVLTTVEPYRSWLQMNDDLDSRT